MPTAIHQALNRLDLQTWNPRITKEYKENLTRRDLYATTLAVEREEGEKIGLEEGEKIGLEKGKIEGEKIGLEEGEKIGLEKGERIALERTACAMKAGRMSVQVIAQLTGLDEEVVEAL
jgi:flagellar biosynthesis/type III secretory pathway protein FliH